jgi:hypothetical protein
VLIREAGPDDGEALLGFLSQAPVHSGTTFVLDRSPDFSALLRLRGQFRTFVALTGTRIEGTATALWRDGLDGSRALCIGEILDLRVAAGARGGLIAARLLRAVQEVFRAEGVDWALCAIGDHNREATRLVLGKAGLPALHPLAHYCSSHFLAWRLPISPMGGGVAVRPATAEDAYGLQELVRNCNAHRPFRPTRLFPWPDTSGQHRAWVVDDPGGGLRGALVVWDGGAVRRIRIIRYGLADQALRAAMAVAGRLALASPLPGSGNPLRVWASRWFGTRGPDVRAASALIRTAVRAAANAGQHVLQLNLADDDPLSHALPSLPRSRYRTTVYGTHLGAPADAALTDSANMCFTDIALV